MAVSAATVLMKNMWRLGSDWGSLWETLVVLVGLRRRGSRSPSQTSAADGHMSTRFQVERERSLPKLRIQKSNATPCRYKSPSPLLPRKPTCKGWSTHSERPYTVWRSFLYKIISNSNYKNYIHSFRRNS